ncbi:MAG: hypothetical protein K6G29_13530 [Clostridiales bacterium]|nr:hypothetical protein [Clostridiales bacterium]
MLKKWLCLMLAALLLFASCSSGDKPGDSGQTAGGTEQNTPADGGEDAVPETEAPETEDPATIFDLEVKNFDGKTVGILGTNWYNIASNWTSPELKVSELTGEAMNDAVYTRNLNMESKYNISFNVVDGGAYLDGTIKNDYLAGTATYDIAFPRISEMNNVAQDGLVFDMNKIDSLDLSKTWWSQFARESLTIHDAIFFISGDMNFMDKWTAVCMFVNKNVAAGYNYTADELYDLVDAGKWTIDKFSEYTNAVTNDSSGDGNLDQKDTWGCTANASYLGNFLHAWADPYTKVVDKELVFNLDNEFTYAAIDRIIDVMNNNVIFAGSWDVAEPVFTAGRALFFIEVTQKLANFRTLEYDFGVLPMVKYDEAQEDYRTTCATLAQMVCIPKTTSDKEFAGYILQAMGYESSLTIAPAYIENALESKFARDERTADMLGYIFRGMDYDIGYQNGMGGVSGQVDNMISSRENTAASKFAAVAKVMSKSLEKVNAAYANAE